MSARKAYLSASLWSADLKNLERSIKETEQYVDSYHLDVMDNHYVPGLLFGADTVRALRGCTRRKIEIHFMVTDPASLVGDFCEAGADAMFFHPDACHDLPAVMDTLSKAGKECGIAIKDEESMNIVLPYIQKIGTILIMGTKLGIKGVGFNKENYSKIRAAAALREKVGKRIRIQMDGGIRKETVPQMFREGADCVTAGSLLFQSDGLSVRKWIDGLV